jgi:hypothetical protein
MKMDIPATVFCSTFAAGGCSSAVLTTPSILSAIAVGCLVVSRVSKDRESAGCEDERWTARRAATTTVVLAKAEVEA